MCAKLLASERSDERDSVDILGDESADRGVAEGVESEDFAINGDDLASNLKTN